MKTVAGGAMKFRGVVLAGLIFVVLAWPLGATAGDLVSGHYLKSSGKEIKVELRIGSPAPASIIVIQRLPKGTGVVSSSPKLKMYNPAKGKAKWLLSKVRPGKTTISMTLDRAIAKGEVSGEVRCRDASGKMLKVDLAE